MADEKIVTSIVANSDFSNLIADVQRVTASLSRLQQEFAGSNRALSGQISATNAMFKETMLKTGQFSSHFVSLTSDVEKFGRNLDSGRLKLKDYFRVYQEHARTSGGLIRDLAKQQVQLQNAVLQPLGRNAQGLMQYNVHIPRGLDLTKNKASLLKQELQIMNKVIQDGGVQLINWGKNTQWAGRQLTVGLTLPLAAFGKAAADAFKVADQELTRLTKVYGDIAGSSAQELGKIRDEISATAKELSSAMGVSFTETIGLAADIAATGKTGNELLASVSETTRLAVLGEVDRQEAMKATLAIQSAFKQNTDQLAESINFLNAVENQTSTTLNDLVEAIPKAGPVIKGLGGSVQDLALYLTAMREGGINASEGANALKSALASLINPTDVAVAKFQTFGIDLLGIVNKNAGDVTGTLLALQGALDTLNPLQKQQAIEQLFGKFQFSRLNALFENLGRQGSQTLQVLDLMKASAGELEAVAGRELAAVTESASGRYRRAVEGLKAELAGVGDEFLDIGTKLINVLSKIIDFSQKLPDPIKKVLAFGGAFTAIIGPVIMLTGVLANFFGYIIKGLGHFKALFKGAEGFKLLTPEIMAARAASAQLADEFYSDAAAADTLRLAIRKLNEDLISLRTNAGSINLQSGLGGVVSTTAGTPIMTVGGGRVVDPNHPLLGGESRAAAHLNPRDPRNPSTIFGLTMQPIPVNRKLGRTPQILMTERLPDIEGLTSAGGISTGVVAGEHARYAALMATLGVQSRQEIEQLKKTIAMGGQVSKEFIDTFDDILPITQRLTQNAAAQSSAIIAQLRAGKLNVEQARAAIISANADLERMMGTEISAYAASRGRTIDLTKAPLIDQPVVDSRGKPNVRGMFRQGIFARVMSAVGRATRTRTFGGPYSIETTRPPGLNQGGKVPGYINGDYVYMTNGETVPGPNVNADVVPAMLTPGEFVLTRDVVAEQGSDNVQALHEGRAMIVPIQRNIGGVIPMLRALQIRRNSISGLRVAGERSGRQAFSPRGLNFESMSRSARRGGTLLPNLQQRGYLTEEELASLSGMIGAHGISRGFLRNIGSRTGQGSYPTSTFEDIFSRFQLSGSFTPTGRSRADVARYIQQGRVAQVLPGSVVHINGVLNTKIGAGTATRADFANLQGYQMTNLLDFLSSQGVPPQLARAIANEAAFRLRTSLPSSNINESIWAKAIERAEQTAIIRNSRSLQKYSTPLAANRGGKIFRANRGGMVPGYRRAGGIVRSGRQRYGDFGVDPRTGLILPTSAISSGFPVHGGNFVSLENIGTTRGTVGAPAQAMGGIGAGSLLGGMLLSTGGYYAGSALGGRFGTAGSIGGGLLGSLLAPALMGGFGGGADYSKKLEKSIVGNTKWAQSASKAAAEGSRFGKMLSFLASGLTKTNLVIAAVAAGISTGVFLFKKYQEGQDRVASSFGMTAEQAKKAGLNYVDLNSKIKEAIENSKALVERNRLIYESLTMSNTPLKLTIEQYKKLKQQVKETMPEVITNINKMNNVEAKDYAVQLKTQFMAYGDTVEEATKKVYALFAVSDKKFIAGSAIAQKSFSQIKTSADAAASAIDLYSKAVDTANSKGQANATYTALQAIDLAIANTIKLNKEQISYYDAMNKTLLEIQSKTNSQKQITADTIKAISNQNFELGNVLNKSDTILSVWAKYQLLIKGVNIDLSQLNAQQAIAVNNAVQLISQNVTSGLIENNAILADENKLLKEKEAQYKKLERITAGEKVQTQINRRDKIKSLQDEIDKINEAAEARKKALSEQQQDEDIRLQLQQKQLEYQDAIATGNMSSAAQLQLEIERLLNEQQLILTERKIEEKRLADIKPLQDKIDSLNKAAQDQADAAALAAGSMSSLSKEISRLKSTISDVTNSIMAIVLGKMFDPNFENTPAGKAAYAALSKLLKDTSNVPGGILAPNRPTLDTSKGSPGAGEVSTYQTKQQAITPTGTGKQFYDAVAGGIEEGLKKNPLVVNAKDVIIQTNAAPTSAERTIGKESLAELLRLRGRPKEQIESTLRSSNLDQMAIQEIIKKYKLNAGETFAYNGVVYDVLSGHNAFLGPKGAVRKWMGGPISGPGTGTSDSIPAWLSNGEYVFSEKAVRNAGGTQAVDELHQYLRKNSAFKDGGPVGDKVNLDGQMFRVNNKNLEQIFSDIESAFAAEPNVKSFKDRADYFKALEEWDNKYSFVLPPKKSYPALGQDLPMGSLRRFLAIANSQAVGGMSSSSFNADITQHAYKMFSPRSFMGKKELLSDPKNFIDNLSEISNLNKFSLWANKNYKIGNDLIAWCGAFIAWVAQQSGVDVSKNMFSAFRATKEYKSLGKFKDPSKIGLNAGDIVWWDFDLGLPKNERVSLGVPDHVDIITKILGRSKIETIGGGFGGGVGKRIKDLSKEGNTLYGSVTPDFKSFKNGGYVGKLHDWNGAVPGPYGKEVSAVLKAGTEGVYQTDYIKSLQNGTIGGDIKINNSFVVNAAPGMNTDDIVNKVAVKVEEATRRAIRKSGTEVNMNRRYM